MTRQAEALVQRYDLLDALKVAGEPRRDLTLPDGIDPRLRDQTAHQLVRWVDYEPSRGGPDTDEGWPTPAGVRVEALCYSPALDGLKVDGLIGGGKVFPLPGDVAEFARQFHVRSGVYAADAAFQEAFRFTPLVVGEVAMTLRMSVQDPGPAFLLLMSRHFDAAYALDERLRAPSIVAGLRVPRRGDRSLRAACRARASA